MAIMASTSNYKRLASPWHYVKISENNELLVRTLISEGNLACATIHYDEVSFYPFKCDWIVFIWNKENAYFCDQQMNGFTSSLEEAKQACDAALLEYNFILLGDKLNCLL